MRTKEEAFQLAKQWAINPYFSQADRNELAGLLERNENSEIFERFYKDLTFGTGGLRSPVGFGANRMNVYNVRKAAYALGRMVLKHYPNQKNKVAISYDSRLTSLEFSEESARVLLGMGIEVLMAPKPTPTPILSYAVRNFKAAAGIMMTASHNPSEYNGFKAYWSDGCQVTPPIDTEIIAEFYGVKNWDDIPRSEKINVTYFDQNFYQKYYDIIKGHLLQPELFKKSDQLKIVYTPLHGTGGEFCTELAKQLGIKNFKLVESQAKPDGHFPTTTYPNPEEPESLKLAVDLMESIGADLVLGSDPDTDRMGVVCLDKGKPYYLNGNEIANLMLYYKLEQLNKQNKIPSHALVIKTIVTSPLQEKICEHFGVEIANTFTGFKWIGRHLTQLEKEGKEFNFLYSSEESFGSMTHGEVRDKDGVSSVFLFTELMLYYKLQGKTLPQVLFELGEQFGHHEERLISLIYPGSDGEMKIKTLMAKLRNADAKVFRGFAVEKKEDYQTLERFNYKTQAKEKIDFPTNGNVLGFYLESGDRIWARPSGTEPKIKFYLQCKGEAKTLTQKLNQFELLVREICQSV